MSHRYKLLHTVSNEILLVDLRMPIMVTIPSQVVAEKILKKYHGVYLVSNIDMVDSDSQKLIISASIAYSKTMPILSNSQDDIKEMYQRHKRDWETDSFCEIEEEDVAMTLPEKPNPKDGWFPIASEDMAMLYARPKISKTNTITIKDLI